MESIKDDELISVLQQNICVCVWRVNEARNKISSMYWEPHLSTPIYNALQCTTVQCVHLTFVQCSWSPAHCAVELIPAEAEPPTHQPPMDPHTAGRRWKWRGDAKSLLFEDKHIVQQDKSWIWQTLQVKWLIISGWNWKTGSSCLVPPSCGTYHSNTV